MPGKQTNATEATSMNPAWMAILTREHGEEQTTQEKMDDKWWLRSKEVCSNW